MKETACETSFRKMRALLHPEIRGRKTSRPPALPFKEVDDALLPCPFCNHIAHIVDMGSGRLHIQCSHCPAALGEAWGDKETRERLIELWNTRRFENDAEATL